MTVSSVAVIGAGVVGKATGVGLGRHGMNVTFVDIDPATLSHLNHQDFHAITPDQIDVNQIDVFFMSVTALTGETGIDLSHIENATDNLGDNLQRLESDRFPVVVFRCTMPPGTTLELIKRLEQRSGKKAEEDFGVIYMPEYLRAEEALKDFLNPRAILLASAEEGNRSHRILRDCFESFNAEMEWAPYNWAEFQKYAHNVFNAVKISYFNEMRRIAKLLDINPERLFLLTTATAESLWDPRYGIKDKGAYGGACLPKDVAAWLFFTEKNGFESPIVKAAQTVNILMGGL